MHNFTKYFKETPGFDRFIMRLYEKYRSLSKFSGTVKLEHLTKQEAISLSRLFGTTYQEKETVSLSIKKFISIMENSKYDDFDIQILVQEYLNVSLVTNKEEKRMSKNEEMEFYQEIIENDDSLGSSWLKKVIEEINKIILESHQIYLDGANKVVDMPEFKKVDVAKDFLNVLDAKDLVADVLNTGMAEDIKIYIGSKTEKEELKNFSIVTFNHLLADKDIGTIGIIGPTRMDYSKVISVMKYISKKLNDDFKNGKI